MRIPISTIIEGNIEQRSQKKRARTMKHGDASPIIHVPQIPVRMRSHITRLFAAQNDEGLLLRNSPREGLLVSYYWDEKDVQMSTTPSGR